jgi:hypothetical protein
MSEPYGDNGKVNRREWRWFLEGQAHPVPVQQETDQSIDGSGQRAMDWPRQQQHDAANGHSNQNSATDLESGATSHADLELAGPALAQHPTTASQAHQAIPVPRACGYCMDSRARRRDDAHMPLDLTDAELVTAATACRAMAFQEGERRGSGGIERRKRRW